MNADSGCFTLNQS